MYLFIYLSRDNVRRITATTTTTTTSYSYCTSSSGLLSVTRQLRAYVTLISLLVFSALPTTPIQQLSHSTHHLTVVKWLNELQDKCLGIQLMDYNYQILYLLFISRKWYWIQSTILSWLLFSFLHSFTIPTSYKMLLDGLIAGEMVTEFLPRS